MRAILLNPGPVTLSDGVRRAATDTDLSHREPEYFDLQDAVRSGIPAVYGLHPAEWQAVLLSGAGSTALEAMVASLLGRDSRLLVLEDGTHGEWLSRIAALHGIAAESLSTDANEAWDLQGVERRLDGGGFTHVAAAHLETATGRLNPAADLAALCDRHGARLLLDTVCSYGAEAIPFDSPALVACAGSADHCLHGIPGLSFVIVRPSALDDAPRPRTLTLHLPTWAEHQARRSTPFTPPIPGMLALRQSLSELEEQGGWQARQRRYRQLSARVRRVLQACGVSPWLASEQSSSVLRSYGLPAGLAYNDVHDGLKLRGFLVDDGHGPLRDEMFLVSTMGEISDYDMSRLETALEAVFGPG